MYSVAQYTVFSVYSGRYTVYSVAQYRVYSVYSGQYIIYSVCSGQYTVRDSTNHIVWDSVSYCGNWEMGNSS